jgi:hypothetical protein
MIAAPLLLGGAVAALVQVAVLPAFYGSAWATPVPACALIAAWAVTRRPDETWAIALAAALVLGVVSIERSGWFLLALLPTIGLAMTLDTVSPRNRSFSARLGRSVSAAAGGTLAYAALLALPATSGGALLEETRALAMGAIGTALLTATIVLILVPLRPRPATLFSS